VNVTAKDLYEGQELFCVRKKIWDPIFNGFWAIVCLDIFSYLVAFASSYIIRLPNYPIENILFSLTHIPYFLLLFAILQIFDAYNTKDVLGNFSLASKSLISSILIIPMIFLFDYLFGTYELNYVSGRGISTIFGITFIIFTTIHRFIFSNFLIRTATKQNWVFIGTKIEFDKFIHDSNKSFRSVYFSFTHLYPEQLPKNPEQYDGIILSPNDNFSKMEIFNQVLKFRMNSGEVLSPYEFSERFWLRIPIDLIKKDMFCLAPGFSLKINSISFQRKKIFDFWGSILLIILSLPITTLTALLIKLTDFGPIFYTQTRTGLHGRTFKVFKFRSMIIDAEKGGPQWAKKNDRRITWIGNIIRKTRIDEIPQFLNVLRGEMSIIGPRPERPEMEKNLVSTIPYYSLRHQIKPGITGWAQVLYPYGANINDSTNKLEYELYYIKNFNPLLDISIALKTIKIILFQKGL